MWYRFIQSRNRNGITVVLHLFSLLSLVTTFSIKPSLRLGTILDLRNTGNNRIRTRSNNRSERLFSRMTSKTKVVSDWLTSVSDYVTKLTPQNSTEKNRKKTEFNQLGKYRNDEDPNIPPIRVKKRPLVSLDPTTGKYTFISEDETLQSTALVLPDTQSTNPFKRWKAYRSIAAAKRAEKRRERNRKREALIDDTKNKIYSVVDSITTLGKSVQTIPQRIEETIEDIENKVQTTNEKVQTTIETVQAIPARIQDSAREIQDAIDETKRISSIVIQDIQNIPQTIDENIKSTQRSLQKTKDDVMQIKAQVQDAVFEAKVLVGLEKPKPLPPPPPPSPKTNQEIATEVAGFLLNSLGKAAWMIGVAILNLSVAGAKLGWSAVVASQKLEEDKMQPKISDDTQPNTRSLVSVQPTAVMQPSWAMSVNSESNTIAEPSSTSLVNIEYEAFHVFNTSSAQSVANLDDFSNAKTESNNNTDVTLADMDASMDKKISEALKSALQALTSAAKRGKKQRTEKSNMELEEALMKAKAAAAQAVNDFAEMEDILKKM